MALEQSGDTIKLGVRIERPREVRIHKIYPLLVFVSFLAVGFTVWLLALEFLGEPSPALLKTLTEDFSLTF